MRVTFGLIAHNNPTTIRTRLYRDLLPTLAHYPHGEFEIVIVDNSANEDRDLHRIDDPVQIQYQWNDDENLQYSYAMNQLVELARHPHFVYLCATHGRMFDPTWLLDILAPLNNPTVGMCGSVVGSIE